MIGQSPEGSGLGPCGEEVGEEEAEVEVKEEEVEVEVKE